MQQIFDSVYRFLKWISETTGYTYREVNVIIYFIIIPAFLFFLISKIYKKKYIIIGFSILVILALFIIPDFEVFSEKLFEMSVAFLNWFKVFGLNYEQASVLICVIIPVLIIVLLFYLYRKTKIITNELL
ncbi:MAG: hypothetical protein EVB11_01430 [Winogradskyella sp.]|nr:MAG: hypothetical protein EVB11_01430 [Winogradskyella sp.]